MSSLASIYNNFGRRHGISCSAQAFVQIQVHSVFLFSHSPIRWVREMTGKIKNLDTAQMFDFSGSDLQLQGLEFKVQFVIEGLCLLLLTFMAFTISYLWYVSCGTVWLWTYIIYSSKHYNPQNKKHCHLCACMLFTTRQSFPSTHEQIQHQKCSQYLTYVVKLIILSIKSIVRAPQQLDDAYFTLLKSSRTNGRIFLSMTYIQVKEIIGKKSACLENDKNISKTFQSSPIHNETGSSAYSKPSYRGILCPAVGTQINAITYI